MHIVSVSSPSEESLNSGQIAERHCAQWLSKTGFTIVERNWKTRRHEIDIIAQKEGATYFIEVKYRIDGRHGVGFEYITESKQTRMARAAEYYMARNQIQGPCILAAASLSGQPPVVDEFTDEITID